MEFILFSSPCEVNTRTLAGSFDKESTGKHRYAKGIVSGATPITIFEFGGMAERPLPYFPCGAGHAGGSGGRSVFR